MISSRLAKSCLALAVFVSAFSPPPSSFGQGNLTPPGGPTPTMKTLQQVEPRTDLQATPAPAGVDTTNADYHFIINQPGSYYLSANLAATKANGIQINAEGVTLDLNGFEISRASGSGGNGIEIAGASHRASIRDGSIKGFAHGVNSISNTARACGFRGLSVGNCTEGGIMTGPGAVLESCRVHDNSGTHGIHAWNGSSLTNCTALNNTVTYAIRGDFGCSFINCSAHDNTAATGISAGTGASLTNCSASNNTSAEAFSAGIATANGSTISHCTANGNSSTAAFPTGATGMGFTSGGDSTIVGCTAHGNKGDGIGISSFTVARDNTCSGNGSAGTGAGIHVTGSDNRIEGNNVTGNDRGIEVDEPGNLIIKNSASGNSPNYDIGPGNIYGAIVDRTIPSGSPIPPAVIGNSAASSANTTDPWANIAY